MNDQIETKMLILDKIEQRRAERRGFLRFAGGATVAAGGLALLAACDNDKNNSPVVTPTPTPTPTPTSAAITDADILNFALNLEYLEAEFYSYAAFGRGLAASMLTGVGTQGAVSTTGSAPPRQVNFKDNIVAEYAREIANDEITHVNFLRAALNGTGSTPVAVAQPALNISGDGAFGAAAKAAGVAPSGVFDPYANDINFLLGAFIFEDVGVTAYKGASPLIANKTYLEAAAGILAAEAYHAGLVRTLLYRNGVDPSATLYTPGLVTSDPMNTDPTKDIVRKISDARDSLDGTSDDDQGIVGADATVSNIVPTNSNSIVFSRTTSQVLHVVYLSAAASSMGGFFPAGMNGTIKTSVANT